MSTRCRLCTSNDRKALVEELAGALWQQTRERGFEPDWADVAPYWRHRFILHAETFLGVLDHDQH